MGTLLVWLSGAQPDLLRNCPAQRAKYVGIGSALLITAAVASVSMTFALVTALKVPLPAAIPFALAWGLAIISLDRWLVVSLQRDDAVWRYILVATPRLLLALLFGFIISTPFVLQIFRPEIEQEITQIQNQRANAYFSQLATDPLTKRIAGERTKVAGLESTIETGGGPSKDPYGDPTVAGLVKQRNQDATQETTDYDQWQCQLYGISQGKSCKAGSGPLAAASEQRYHSDIVLVQQDNARIKTAAQQVVAREQTGSVTAVAAAKAALPAAKRALARDVNEQSSLSASFEAKNASTAGLLLRLQALSDATAHNGTLNAARLLLFALFTTIECLPILVKTLLNLSKANTYENLLAEVERLSARRATEEYIRDETAKILEAESKFDEAQRLAAEREAMIPRVTQEAIAAEQRVAIAMIENWEEQETQNIARYAQPRHAHAWTGQEASVPQSDRAAPRGQDRGPQATPWPDPVTE